MLFKFNLYVNHKGELIKYVLKTHLMQITHQTIHKFPCVDVLNAYTLMVIVINRQVVKLEQS